MSLQRSSDCLRLPAPAKLNLFLHITGHRADGYHVLESAFVPISLADTVELRLRKDGEIRLLDAPLGLSADNDLACRAARALQAETGCTLGADIRLSKRIPQGAGLGGGSSDAATALIGLDHLWRLKLPSERLLAIGLKLGADVPFFIFGKPALATGVGESLRALTLPAQHVVLAHPRVPVATAAVFQHPKLKRDSVASRSAVFTLRHGNNDMQMAAEQIEPKVAALCKSMATLGLVPRMSGSGSAVFALVDGPQTARRNADLLAATGVDAWAVQTLYRHPLQSFFGAAII
jgi:4-diphosphocytidyl-2-C-methyl-D-erythritol kinase